MPNLSPTIINVLEALQEHEITSIPSGDFYDDDNNVRLSQSVSICALNVHLFINDIYWLPFRLPFSHILPVAAVATELDSFAVMSQPRAQAIDTRLISH